MKLQSGHKKYKLAMRRGSLSPQMTARADWQEKFPMRFEKEPTPGGDFFAAAVASLIRIRPRGVK